MESKHTPGPWAVSQNNPTRVNVEPGVHVNDEQEDDVWIANCDGDHFADDNHEALEANARLIAAAPELLDACAAAMRAFEEDTTPSALSIAAHAACKAAITKAQGH